MHVCIIAFSLTILICVFSFIRLQMLILNDNFTQVIFEVTASIFILFSSIDACVGRANESCFKEQIPGVTNGGERSGVTATQ